MYLGLHQASAVVADLPLPDGVPQPIKGFERAVVRGPVGGLVARFGTLGCGHAPRLLATQHVFVRHLARRAFLGHTVAWRCIPVRLRLWCLV